MKAIDLNDDGQHDVMDEDIEDHEVLEDSQANKGTQPRQVQSSRRVSRCWRKFTILGGRLSMVQLRSDATFVEGFTSSIFAGMEPQL
ncbi:hypothetical protein Bca52824_066802 [Brassica carinata]|uniref:Uncharacterized protein n=1 Tax=Brassica carinata TaxID=52824 RepID=A0A8X7QMI4_BRACI|nr:hypothetical protein Bca52824_066802 [Brassica carinata]